MPSNRIDAAFTAEQRDKAKADLATLAETLPLLIELSAESHPRNPPRQVQPERIPRRPGTGRKPLSPAQRRREPSWPDRRFARNFAELNREKV
jgi:hypothetical protein